MGKGKDKQRRKERRAKKRERTGVEAPSSGAEPLGPTVVVRQDASPQSTACGDTRERLGPSGDGG